MKNWATLPMSAASGRRGDCGKCSLAPTGSHAWPAAAFGPEMITTASCASMRSRPAARGHGSFCKGNGWSEWDT
jgi:hypothetical protein